MRALQHTRHRELILAALLIAFGTIVYSRVVIQDYSGPLIGGENYDGQFRGDANYFEWLGYYVRDHWKFGIHPISFFTTDVAYPLGTHVGLLSWCAERDLFCAALLTLFGRGPWIQIYLTLGALLGAVGVTAILAKPFGTFRASLVGFAASFMSFYAWYKYPYHLNMVALHWVTMSIAADARMIKRVAEEKPLTAPFIMLRIALIIMSMGLDLGYIAGHALTSLTVSIYCIWVELGKRDRRLLRRFRLLLPADPIGEIKQRKLAFTLVSALALFGVLFILPFVQCVVKDTRAYPMTDAAGNFWASWFHALFPYLPGLHPSSKIVKWIFGQDEGIGEYTPGFTLLLAAGVSIWLAHRRNTSFLIKPFLITFLLVFAFHPRWCKTLQIFPWFAYNRVAGRGTVVMPELLAIIAVMSDGWPRWARRAVSTLAVAEFLTAAFLVSEFRPTRLQAQHVAYFQTIAKSPGKALLEWPFCIASANVVITKELCPYYERNATQYANKRFHEKATVSIYLSRAHPTQFRSWLDDGWEHQFTPDDPTRLHAKHETQCFDEEKWTRFDNFYRANDFAGIQIYTALLPPECVKQFHQRYGEPTAAETIPRAGYVEFFRRK